MGSGELGGTVSISERMFAMGGQMGELMQRMDWTQTPLGPLENWPQSLRTALSICLTSRFPMLIWWGPQLTMLYNDAYRPMLGAKHPRSMGQAGLECWAEITDIIGPMLRRVQETGEATWSVDQLLPLERKGFAEECYFTFSYSPIIDESGGIGGVFTAVTETTQQVIGERRIDLLRRLAASATEARTVEEICSLAAEILDLDPSDLPFACVYLLDPAADVARIACASGVDADRIAAEYQAIPRDKTTQCALWRVVEARTPEALEGLRERLLAAGCPAERAVDRALLVPIQRPGQERPFGVLVAGLSERLEGTDDYRGFLGLVAGQLASLLASAQAREEEQRRLEALAELDRAKTMFFSNVSHEFRTPLTLLLGPIEEALEQGAELPDRLRAQLDVARRNGQRLLKLVNTLLEFSRIESGRLLARYEPVDLSTLTKELASVFRSLIEKAGLTYTITSDELSEPIYVDSDMWEKIVLNLLSNAFKFTFEGEIAVHLSEDERAVTLEVRDTGIGIAEQDQAHLFERFHRVQGARSRSYEGSGIGLALVQELVRLHGGAIAVSSEPGAGARFLVTIPKGSAHLPAEQVHMAPTPATSSSNRAQYVEEAGQWLGGDGGAGDEIQDTAPTATATNEHGASASGRAHVGTGYILLADDNADMREYLMRLLGERWRVVAVSNGRAALEAARRRHPDLILSDVMMPEMDGLQLVQALRADPEIGGVPIILLSARAGQEAAIEGLEAGADDYLVKPFSGREVIARVAAHMELAPLRRETLMRAREFETAFEAITDALFIYDKAGRITRTNEAARSLYALDAQPAYEESAPDERARIVQAQDEQGRLIPVEESGLVRLLRGEALTGGNTQEVRLLRLDGRELHVSVSGAPLLDESNDIVGAIAVARDVTERRQLEQRTRQSLYAMLTMAHALVAPEFAPSELDDPGQSIASAGTHGSPLAHRLAELTREVLGCQRVSIHAVDPTTRLRHPLAVVGLEPDLEDAWWADQESIRVRYAEDASPEHRARLEAGESVVLDMRESPYDQMPNPYNISNVLIVPMRVRGEVVGVLSLDYVNVPAPFPPSQQELAEAVARLAALALERDKLLRERESARADVLALQRATQRMDDFLGVASHELRTPLTSISANIQFGLRQTTQLRALEAERLDELSDKIAVLNLLLERTARQIGRLDRLVGDLLDVSRIQAGRLSLDFAPTELRAIALDATQEQQAAWPGRAIRCETPDGELRVVADADRIGQVITNFLTNALKYSPAQSPVIVRAEREGDRARVSVRDEGPGIPKREQQRVWERFHRVPGIEQQSGSGIGLGLGLFICASIIERHGGVVGLHSAPGKGSTFWFTLPLAEDR